MELKPLEMNPEDLKPFVQVLDFEVEKLLPILKKRLPYSVFAYNSVLMYPRFKDRMTFYTLFGDIDETSWIVSVVVAEDYGLDYTISASQDKVPRDQAVKIMESCPLFKWDEPHLFTPLEKWLTSIIYEISVTLKGNVVEFHPSKIFWMDIDVAKNIDVARIHPDSNNNTSTLIKVQRLDPEKGTKFMISTWKYALKATELIMSRNIERNESGSVVIDGVPVCGVMCMAFGMVSALHTVKEHRQKGYANFAMNFIFRELAQNGIIPASGVDLRNAGSIAFHQKLGCSMSHDDVAYIICSKHEF